MAKINESMMMNKIDGQDNKGYVEDENKEGPGAPPYDPNNPIVGYENVGVNDTPVAQLPQTDTRVLQDSGPREAFQDVPILTEDEAKQALLEYVNSKCCYGKTPVKQMSVTDIQSSNSYRYLLQTFHETRSTQWVHEAYHGGPLYNNGMPPPRAWDIPVGYNALFTKEKKKLEVPNTAYVKTCHSCHGRGSHICSSCRGSGRDRCSSCGGRGNNTRRNADGTEFRETCSSCGGSGRRTCWRCGGSGRTTCLTCSGAGRLKWYIELTVKFDTQIDDFIKKSEDIPDDKIRKCQAVSTFAEQNPRVYAINHHHDPQINQASVNLIQAHLTKLQNSRILMQAQVVFAIPVTLCKYKFKEKDYQYQIFGLDKRVHAPDYAHKCCCCCSIV